MGVFIFWIIFSILVGLIGKDRKIGGTVAFILALILSPLIGGIITLISDKNSDIEYKKQLAESLSTPNRVSDLDEIEKLHSLFEKGILTEEEYNKRKATLLG